VSSFRSMLLALKDMFNCRLHLPNVCPFFVTRELAVFSKLVQTSISPAQEGVLHSARDDAALGEVVIWESGEAGSARIG
jgi:hypothetical protein